MSRRRHARLRALSEEFEYESEDEWDYETESNVNNESAQPQISSKRLKRERPRPEVPYVIEHNVPVSLEPPDFSRLQNPQSEKASRALSHAIHTSRANWLSGSMFETYWTRKVKGKKLPHDYAARERMLKAAECEMELGPHTFRVKVFIVRDDNDSDDEDTRPVTAPGNGQGPSIVATNTCQQSPRVSSSGSSVISPAITSSIPNPEPNTLNVTETSTDTQKDTTNISLPKMQAQIKNDLSENSEAVRNDLTRPDAENKPVPALGTVDTTSEQTESTTGSGLRDTQNDLETNERKLETNSATKSRTVNSDSDPGSRKELEGADTGSGCTHQIPDSKADIHKQRVSGAPEPSINPTVSSKAPPAAASQPPPAQAASNSSSSTNVNQMVIFKLQQMAQRDQSLAELMKIVATGKAPAADVARFQNFINQAKMAVMFPRGPPQRAQQSARPVATPPKSTMLVFEFEENQNERFIIPKNGVVEILSNNDILWSFLHTPSQKHSDEELEEREEPNPSGDVIKTPGVEKKAPQPENLVWTSVTIRLRGIPQRLHPSIERCASRLPRVLNYMERIMKAGSRADAWFIWTKLDKHDQLAHEAVRKSAPPTLGPPPQPKKILKTRKSRYETSKPASETPANTRSSPKPALERKPRRPLLHVMPPDKPVAPPPERPRLNLPSLDQIKLPPGGLPPLPRSLQALVPHSSPAKSQPATNLPPAINSGTVAENQAEDVSKAGSEAAIGDK